MKIIKHVALWLSALSALLLLSHCGEEGGEDPTFAQSLSKTWQVSRALINGSEDTGGDYSGFRLTFTADNEGNPATYTVSPGAAPSKPNYSSASNSGTWSLSGTTQITFDVTSTVAIIGTPTDTNLTLEWTLPEDIEKTEPTYRFELVAQ